MEMQKGGRGGGLAEGGALGLNPPKSDRHLPLKELRCALRDVVHKAYLWAKSRTGSTQSCRCRDGFNCTMLSEQVAVAGRIVAWGTRIARTVARDAAFSSRFMPQSDICF